MANIFFSLSLKNECFNFFSSFLVYRFQRNTCANTNNARKVSTFLQRAMCCKVRCTQTNKKKISVHGFIKKNTYSLKNICSKHSWARHQFRSSVGWESSSDLDSKEYISNITPFIFLSIYIVRRHSATLGLFLCVHRHLGLSQASHYFSR